MKARLLGAVVGASALVVGSVGAHAGGLFIPGAGPQAQSRAGAFVAKADDTTAMFHNPAGFMKGTGTVVQIGVNLVNMSLEFSRHGVYESPIGQNLSYDGQRYPTVSDNSKPAIGIGGFQAIPTIGVSTDFGLQKKGIPIRFGFSIMAPQAYPERNFDKGYQFEGDINEAPPPQRYDVVTQEAATVLPSVAVAYQVNDKLDIGARFSAGFAELKGSTYVWGIANYKEWIARDGIFDVDVKDNFVPAFGFGLLYRPTTNLELGFSYSSSVEVHAKGTGVGTLGSDLGFGPDMPDDVVPLEDFDGKPRCGGGGTREALPACVDFSIPQTVHVGARYILRDGKGGEKADIEFDVKWENWADASDIFVAVDGKDELLGTRLNESIIRHNLIDSFSFRVGGSYALPVGKNLLAIKAGVAYDTKSAVGSWNRLDIDSKPRVTLGTGIAFTFGKVRIEAGGGVVLEKDRTVSTSCSPTITNEGCLGTGEETPREDREFPDPVQPLVDPLSQQIEKPFTSGEYKSGYVLLHFGVTTWF